MFDGHWPDQVITVLESALIVWMSLLWRDCSGTSLAIVSDGNCRMPRVLFVDAGVGIDIHDELHQLLAVIIVHST